MKNLLINQCQQIEDPSLPTMSNICNILAILFYEMEDLNWCGLYYCDENKKECILGPFQGKVACTRIPYGKGVVGTCALKKEPIIVNNVHSFPGHIACDSASQSEIVLPLIYNNQLLAILDIDSPKMARFERDEAETLKVIANQLSTLVSSDKLRMG